MAAKPAKKTRQRNPVETRRRIVSATLEAINDEGYKSTSVDSIAARAGVGRATFYLHFKSKSDALLGVWENERNVQLQRVFKEFLTSSRLGQAALFAWLDEVMDIWQDNRQLALASNQAIAEDANLVAEWALGISRMTRRSLGEDIPEDDERFLVFNALLFQFERLAFLHLSSPEVLSRDDIMAMIRPSWAMFVKNHPQLQDLAN